MDPEIVEVGIFSKFDHRYLCLSQFKRALPSMISNVATETLSLRIPVIRALDEE